MPVTMSPLADLNKSWPGGGVSGPPENPPGYATAYHPRPLFQNSVGLTFKFNASFLFRGTTPRRERDERSTAAPVSVASRNVFSSLCSKPSTWSNSTRSSSNKPDRISAIKRHASNATSVVAFTRSLPSKVATMSSGVSGCSVI